MTFLFLSVTKHGLAARGAWGPMLWQQCLGEENAFIDKLTHKETGGEVQVCRPSPEIRMSFKGLEGTGCYSEVLAGQVFTGQLWSLALYGKGFSRDLPEQWTLRFRKGSGSGSSSGYAPVFWCGGGRGG